MISRGLQYSELVLSARNSRLSFHTAYLTQAFYCDILRVHSNRTLTYKESLLTMIEKSREGIIWGLSSPNYLFAVAVAVVAVSECLLIVRTDFQANKSFRLRLNH